MSKEPQPLFRGMDVGEGENAITIWVSQSRNVSYSAIYQNKDTKNLDVLFGLSPNIQKLPKEEKKKILYSLDKAVETASLGDTQVEVLLRYFVSRAKSHLYFVGLPEEELKRKINDREDLINDQNHPYKRYLTVQYIDRALQHKDYVFQEGIVTKVSYLKRVQVKDKYVLFPANLRKR